LTIKSAQHTISDQPPAFSSQLPLLSNFC